jgi:hypothetical protein
VNRDDAADMDSAHASLFHGRDPGPGASPWPDAVPYVNVWCPHRKARCRIGSVYLTHWGYFWLHLSRKETVEHVGPRFIAKPGRWSAGYTLLTFPDGSPRSFGHTRSSMWGNRSGCRHWKPTEARVPFDADEMFALLADVRSGRVKRPANYVAPWNR